MGAKNWNAAEHEILDRVYPTEGSRGVHILLPHRPMESIKVLAHRRGLTTVVGTGTPARFSYGEVVAALIAEKWAVKRAMFALGCSEHTVRRALERYRTEERAAANARIAARRAKAASQQVSA